MKRTIKLNIFAITCVLLFSTTVYGFEWTTTKNIRVTQTQIVGQALAIYTDGSWFAAGHRCEEKVVVFLVPKANDSGGYEDMFAQVLLAHANNKPVRFGLAIDDCDSTPNPYFRAEYIQVSN